MQKDGHIHPEMKEHYPLLSKIPKGMPFHLPADFFSEHAEALIRRVSACPSMDGEPEESPEAELSRIAPTLLGIPKTPPFLRKVDTTVDAGRLEAVQKAPEGNPHRSAAVRRLRTAMRYAAAAAVLLTTGLALRLWPSSPEEPQRTAAPAEQTVKQGIDTLSDETLLTYLAETAPMDGSTTPPPGMPDEASTPETNLPSSTATDPFQDLLADVQDEELLDFERNHPSSTQFQNTSNR